MKREQNGRAWGDEPQPCTAAHHGRVEGAPEERVGIAHGASARGSVFSWLPCQHAGSHRGTRHQDNLFEFHFTIRGSAGTDFDGGLYHGRILLPHNYPLRPPNIVFLTPNGRFEVGMKICLTVSAHHPESWQPSWSIRTVLTAIIGFMPSAGGGAIGSIDYSTETRQKMARESRKWKCPVCNKCNDELLPAEDAETLKASQSELSTSVAAVMDEQAQFPTAQIVIEKIERLDESGTAAVSPAAPESGLRRRGAPASDPTEEDEAELVKVRKADLQSNNNNNNNNNNNVARPPHPPPAAEVVAEAPAVAAAPAAFTGGSLIDIVIAAIFFFLLFLMMNKWIAVK